MGAKYGATTSLRSCCVVLGDQDGWGTNRLSKAESILGTGISQNLSRGRRHACPVVIRKRITLDGDGKVTVNGGSNLTIEADGEVVRGLHLSHSGDSHDQVDAGILIKANDTVVQDNIIDDSLFGIHLSSSHGNQVIGNRMTNSRISMELVFSPENEICGNTFNDNYNGITVIYSDELTIADNHILRMRKLTGSGISVKESYDILIDNNEIAHCAVGLLATSPLEAENILTITNNLFTFNDVAAYFYGEKGGHQIYDNRFIDNFVDAMGSTTHTSRLNNWKGNYWDSYSGFDLNHDGVGDQPHRVYLYADSIWMERFYRGTPALTLIDFVERLIPSSEPDLMYADPAPLMTPKH